jgi:hypothetical protein
VNGLPGLAGQEHRAILDREIRAIRVLVVDRLVARLALELGEGLVAERAQRRGIGVADEAVLVDDPDRLGDAVEDRPEERLRLDVPAGQRG